MLNYEAQKKIDNNVSYKEQITFIVLLRILAAFAVIVIHTRSMTFYETNIYNFVHACMLWSVPVFFMITGYIFIGVKKISDFSSIKNNVIKFVVVLFTLGFFYAICQRFFETRNFTVMLFINSFCDVLKGNLFDHMWYIYAIIGIYLILPMLSLFVNSNKKNLYILLVLTAVLGIIIPDICKMLNISTSFKLPIGNYAFYVLAGATIKEISVDKLKVLRNISLLIIPLYILIYAYNIFVYDVFYASYTSILVASLSVSVFIICAYSFRNLNTNIIINSISECTWGIYLLHPFFIHVIVKLFKFTITPYNQLIFYPLSCIFIFLISYVATLILKNIPIIKRFI